MIFQFKTNSSKTSQKTGQWVSIHLGFLLLKKCYVELVMKHVIKRLWGVGVKMKKKQIVLNPKNKNKIVPTNKNPSTPKEKVC